MIHLFLKFTATKLNPHQILRLTVTHLVQAQTYLKGGAMLRTLVAQLQQPDAAVQFKLAQVLPQRYTLFDIANGLSECESLPERRVIEGVSLCLKQTDRIERRSVDVENAVRIANYAARLFKRTPDGLPSRCPSSDNAAPVDDVLAVLLSLVVHHSLRLDDGILLAVVAYADGREDWSSPTTALIARDLLDHALGGEHQKTAFITSVVLERFTRPIFSQYSSSRLTSAGRKAYYQAEDHDQVTRSALSSDTDTKPWKSTQPHAVTVFAWTVEQSDEHIIATKWPLFVPILLCLIDDTDTAYKARGLAILQEFLERSPASILRDTGLGEIFEQSIFPSLMSLPTLTPEDESIQLLVPAYSAVIRLADAQFPDSSNGPQKNRFLVRLLREGILAGYWHASDYAGIVEVLSRQVSSVVRRLGTSTIPHIKGLLSMLTTILSDPFIVARPECVQAASQALSTVLLNCWSRVADPTHSHEVLRAVSVCWLNLKDVQGVPQDEGLQDASVALASLARLLSAIFESAGMPSQQQFAPLCDVEPRLSGLFNDAERAAE